MSGPPATGVGPGGTPPGALRQALPTLLAVLAGALVVHAGIQAALPGITDRDAWFHGRYAELLGRGEIPWDGNAFPWLTQSAYADNPMDWSLLWHVLLAPFAVLLGPVTGIRAFTVLQAAVLTTAFFGVLRALRVRAPLAWTALLLAGSGEWLFRLHGGRPTPAVLATMLVVVALVLRRRDALAAAAVTFSLLLYQVPAPIVLAAGAGWLGRLVDEHRPPWRSALLLAAGGVAGVLLHPGLWNGGTLHVWKLMAGSVEVAAAGGTVTIDDIELGLSLPRELARPGAAGMLRDLWVPLAATVVAIGGAWRARGCGTAVAGALLAAAGFAATWRSGRFHEYWHVLAVVGAALAASGPGARGPESSHRRVIGATAAVLAILCVRSLVPLTSERFRDGGGALAPAMAAVHERSRPGDVVWHVSWDDFAPLFHFAPDLRFVQGMDPWWCVVRDGNAALAHAYAGNGQIVGDDLREILIARFHARFVVLWSQPEDGDAGERQRARLEQILGGVDWAERLHRDERTTVYVLTRP